MTDIKDAQQKLEAWAADLERGMEVHIAPGALRKIAAALATPQPAQQNALSEVVGCFDAALADCESHRSAWGSALSIAQFCATEEADVSYWGHEIRAFNRAFDILTAPQPAPPAELQDAANLLSRLERQWHRMGELWGQHQGKGWPVKQSDEFKSLRDEETPAARTALLGLLAPQHPMLSAVSALLGHISDVLEDAEFDKISTEKWNAVSTFVGIDRGLNPAQPAQPAQPAPRDEPTPQAVPVAWLHPANAFCVTADPTADPTAYARGIPLIPRQLLEQHQAAHEAEMSRLRKTEAEWAALSQDEGKALREIARLHDCIKELSWDVEYLTQQAPVAWGLFAKVGGDWVLQHPVRFTEHDANVDRAHYESGTQLDVRPLGVVAKLPAARFTEHDAVTVRYDLSPAQVEGAIEAKLISMGWTPPSSVAKASGVAT